VQRILTGTGICRHRVVGHGDVFKQFPNDMGFDKRLDPGKEFFWSALESNGLATRLPANVTGGVSPSGSNYGEFFAAMPGGQLQMGDSDTKMIWGGKSFKNTPTGTLIAQQQPVQQLQKDLATIGYFVNPQLGEYTDVLNHTVFHLQHRIWTGSNFTPTVPFADRRAGRPHIEGGSFDEDTCRMLLAMLADIAQHPCT
jgi:hypothetical protein